MRVQDTDSSKPPEAAGRQMHALAGELFPICRSITGDGVRNTLRILREHIPLEVREVATGTAVLDWTVPKEWNIRQAYVDDVSGKRIIDFNNHNLHVLNYSAPIRKRVTRDELAEHVFALPDNPELIPYKTSYYKENWGFCMSQRQWDSMRDREYDVVIDSSLGDGYLTYGELFLGGRTSDEFLVSTHICHPSLANDNLSGIVVMTELAKHISQIERKFSYRFLFIPGTIGAITWLAQNEPQLDRIRFGLVTACLGDPGAITYKKSRLDNAEIDRVVQHVLESGRLGHAIRPFSPYGYDERQYCSPGFNLPVGHLSRTPHGEFKEYHTSADNLEFISPEALSESLTTFLRIVDTVECGRYYKNMFPKGEPQLGRRGLYSALGGHRQSDDKEMAMLWVLNMSDGRHATWDIARQSGIRISTIEEVSELLLSKGLLVRSD